MFCSSCYFDSFWHKIPTTFTSKSNKRSNRQKRY